MGEAGGSAGVRSPRERISEAHGAEHRGRAAGGGEGQPGRGGYRGSAEAGVRDSGGADGGGAGIVFDGGGVLRRLASASLLIRADYPIDVVAGFFVGR